MPTCKDCIHYEVCQYHIDEETDMTIEECEHYIPTDIEEKYNVIINRLEEEIAVLKANLE